MVKVSWAGEPCGRTSSEPMGLCIITYTTCTDTSGSHLRLRGSHQADDVGRTWSLIEFSLSKTRIVDLSCCPEATLQVSVEYLRTGMFDDVWTEFEADDVGLETIIVPGRVCDIPSRVSSPSRCIRYVSHRLIAVYPLTYRSPWSVPTRVASAETSRRSSQTDGCSWELSTLSTGITMPIGKSAPLRPIPLILILQSVPSRRNLTPGKA